MTKQVHLILTSLGGFFLIVSDQLLKYLARTEPTATYYLIEPWLGWELFLNPGVAFSLPFPNSIIIIITPLIILGLVLLASKKDLSALSRAGLVLIIAGALSNFIDRVLFNTTTDYIRILTSVINLADVAIVSGAALLFAPWKKEKA